MVMTRTIMLGWLPVFYKASNVRDLCERRASLKAAVSRGQLLGNNGWCVVLWLSPYEILHGLGSRIRSLVDGSKSEWSPMIRKGDWVGSFGFLRQCFHWHSIVQLAIVSVESCLTMLWILVPQPTWFRYWSHNQNPISIFALDRFSRYITSNFVLDAWSKILI